MKKKRRKYNTRLIKATWPYTVQEIAALFKVHKNAPLRWLREGLQANIDGRPYLIRGDELIRFLNARQQGRERKCKLGEFYCFKCRAVREPYLNIVDIAIQNSTRLRIKSICSVCSIPISKIQHVNKLHEIGKCFNIQKQEGLHIIESDEPNVNSDLERKI